MLTLPTPRVVVVMTVVAALTGPASVIAQTPAATTTTTTPPSAADHRLVTTFTKVDRDEVLMARAALPTLQDAEVKRYAQRMIDDHTAHLASTTAIGARLQVPQAAEVTPGGEAAPTTDADYLTAMVTGHQQLLSQLPADPSTIQDPALRQLLADTRRTVQGHLDDAIRIKARLSGRAP